MDEPSLLHKQSLQLVLTKLFDGVVKKKTNMATVTTKFQEWPQQCQSATQVRYEATLRALQGQGRQAFVSCTVPGGPAGHRRVGWNAQLQHVWLFLHLET